MNIPMVTLAAFMALIPFISSAQSVEGCTLNGVAVPGDPEVIEGTLPIRLTHTPTRSRCEDNRGLVAICRPPIPERL